MQTIRHRAVLRDYGRPDRQRFLRRDRWLPEGLAFAIFCAVCALFLVIGVPA